ncbi:MAG TPA: nucleoside-triphosphatase [Bacteroidia bacterium]|nr:nucleoside-triphosphatase [Bacteroidia bacterium]
MKIFILKGAIGSGKTTSLLKYCEKNRNAGGILSPIINGQRHFLNVENKETKLMEAEENEIEILNIGRYKFSAKAFEWANQILMDSVNKNYETIIIDEIGPLELQGKGFAETLKFLLRQHEIKPGLLLVVRENLANDVLNYFGIKKEVVYDFE